MLEISTTSHSSVPPTSDNRRMAELIRQLVWTILSLFALSFWVNVSMLIEWSSLTDNIGIEGNRCNQHMNLCRHRYPLLQDPTVHSAGTMFTAPDWNTSAVGDDADSFGRCRCDVDCALYGDCCADAADVYDNHPKGSLSSPWTCLPMATEADRYTSSQKFYMYMIGSCPMDSTNHDDFVAALCHRRMDKESSNHQYSYLTDIPVLSLATNRTYANIYCAQCHSDTRRLAPWNISVHCNDDFDNVNVTRDQMFLDENYQPGTRSWVLHRGYVTISCVLIIDQFNQPANYLKSAGGRHCVPIVNDCLSDWQDTAEGRHCDVYTLYVETSAVEVPKNPHCSDRFLHSFSIVMDFKFGAIHTRNGKTCGPNEIVDGLHDSCHAVACDAAISQQAPGICSPPQQNKSNNNTSLNIQCSKVTLIKNVHYYSLGNGTLVLNGTGDTLRPSDYELGQNGIIKICENESFGRFLNELKNYLKYSYAQRYLSNVCLTISVICLAFHIGIHIALPKLRNVPGKNLLSLSCTLFLGQLLFLTGVGARNSIGYGPCAAIGVLIHWSLMAAFFWMNIMGFDMCRTFAGSQIKPHLQFRASVQRRRTTFRSYSFYGWSCPTLIVAIAMVVDFTDITDGKWAPNYGTHQCWICNKNGLGLFFILPMAVLLAVNFMFFLLTAWSIVKQWRETQFAMRKNQTCQRSNAIGNFLDSLKLTDMIYHRKRKSYVSRLRNRFFLYVKLGTIMGLGWVSGLIAAMADVPALWYPFILFNTLQGTFIFLAFDCKRKVYYMVYEVITQRPHPSNLSSSHRCSTTASTKLQAARRISVQTPPAIYNNQECQNKAV